MKENYDGKYYVDIEDEDEDALYSSDIEFNSKTKAVSWAYDELEKNQDNDDVYQASIYQMFINDDGDLDHELIEVIHKDDLDDYDDLDESYMSEANKVVPDENDFEKCPYCGSHNTDIRYDVDLDTPADVLAHATCKDCGKKYQGQFMFTGAYYGNGEKDYEPVDTCPLCGTKNYTETVQFDGNGYVDQDFKCKNCGVTWYNSFVWNDNPSVFECNCHKSKSKKSSRKRHLIHESSNSDILRRKIFNIGYELGLDVYGKNDGGIVFEDEHMITADDDELLDRLEKFGDSIIITYNDEDNVVVYLKEELD